MAITFKETYKGNSILTSKEKGLGCNTEILDKIRGFMNYTTQIHNKVLVVRLDLRYPKNYHAPEDNSHISEFTSKYIKQLKREGYDPYYLWVREQSREKHQHYHLMIAVDGNKMQFPHKLMTTAEKHWASTIGSDQDGLVDHCNKSRQGESQPNSYRLRRNDPDFDQVYDECHKRCSYLAKENTKGCAPKRAREVGCSRIPRSIY
ncbi:inovirus-type Gp2 protein [Maridesulfovibrio ferrireducens]|uniref:YagK/YfjJ domain-containing protein n=1 Tax=Maridesulfovibrio ferrireducens TaxID=246191 RepID=UPI001A1E8BE3|nr:inovirus-type Gp2 protein [Maridesulfovibrio ferrireducens]MBI9113314.1 inovirus-type Gp2 protein [Maridesulfovibrio ferrireducens]